MTFVITVIFCFESADHPDMTFVVGWALKIKCLDLF